MSVNVLFRSLSLAIRMENLAHIKKDSVFSMDTICNNYTLRDCFLT